MSEKHTVRIGITGVGSMGANHAKRLLAGDVPGAELAAVCDTDKVRLEAFPDVPGFPGQDEMLASGAVDAVVVATPHYDHTPLSIAAIEKGIHVLVEKPLGVHKADCERTIAAYEARTRKDQVFAVMFNQRTRLVYKKLKAMITSGDLGEIRRVSWTVTNWFRSELYYRRGARHKQAGDCRRTRVRSC